MRRVLCTKIVIVETTESRRVIYPSMKVSYDNRAVILEGVRTLLLSGAIHYPRSTPAMWPALMRRSREAGLNTIETYVFWNLHERRRGLFDFSDRLDLVRFCRVAEEHGLNVILRIGPYICAETNYGGFPFWLRDIPNMQMRTENEPFQREVEKWVRFLTDMMRPLFASNGGPIILAQIENEYDNIAKNYGAAGQRYLQWSVDLGRELKLGIPWITCLGGAEGSIETINAFRAHELIDAHFAEHADQPALWTEMWAGWYDVWGVAHHTRDVAETAYAAARFFAGGGTGINYYMWHGGTNFDRESMYLQTTSYDFDAPLDEFGLTTTKSNHLGALHHALMDCADDLLAHDRAKPETLANGVSAFVYGETVFLCNDSEAEARVEFHGKSRLLAPLSVQLVRDGRVLFDSSKIAKRAVVRREWLDAGVVLAPFMIWHEPMPAQSSVQSSPRPLEQLQFTADETDYCWYETDLEVTSGREGALVLERAADVVHVFVDGKFIATSPMPLEDRGATDSDGFRQEFRFQLTKGTHRLSLLCCAVGLIKGDWMIGQTNMANERKGIWGAVRWNDAKLRGKWTMRPGLIGERARIFADAANLVDWKMVPNKLRPLSWLHSSFQEPARSDALAIDLSALTKGIAWLNGRCLGRYWLAAGASAPQAWQRAIVMQAGIGEPTQRYYHLPNEWLRAHNELVLFEELGGMPAEVRLLRRAR